MKKEDVFGEMFDEVRSFLNLWHYHISFNFNRETKDEYDASLKVHDITHYQAMISYWWQVWEQMMSSFDGVILLTIHEMSHIFTSTGLEVLDNEEEDLAYAIWMSNFLEKRERFIIFAEQQTNVLDKVLFREFKKTKEYRELKKKYKLIK